MATLGTDRQKSAKDNPLVDPGERKISLLVVEDDDNISTAISEYFSRAGYSVKTVEDGLTGVKAALDDPPDAVVLDLMLPKMDGLEILRRYKKQPSEKPNGSVVLLTNLGQDSIIKEGFNLGASGYLIKSSMNPDQVLSEVKVFLTKSGESK